MTGVPLGEPDVPYVSKKPLLCRIGLHRWVKTIGNYPGEDRWWKKTECSRCGLLWDDPKDPIGTERQW